MHGTEQLSLVLSVLSVGACAGCQRSQGLQETGLLGVR